MELHRQRCQKCESLDLRNILVRASGRKARVYVRCARCGELVARYVLNGYYHHHKGVESWVRAGGQFHEESGRDTAAFFDELVDEAEREYAEVLAELERQNKPI